MTEWAKYSLIALFLWGIWGFLGKLCSNTLTTRQLLLFTIIGYALMVPIVLIGSGKEVYKAGIHKDAALALAAGFISAAAYLCFYMALSKGEASRIVVMTSLYPVITCVLSFIILKEPIRTIKIIGIISSMIGIVLLMKK